MVGVDDGPAFEGGRRADDLNAAAGSVDRDLGAGGDVAPFFGSGRDADSVVRVALVSPAERRRRGLEDGAQPRVLEVFQPEFQRVDLQAWASSSMCDSRAKWLAVEARRDRNPGGGAPARDEMRPA